MLDLVRAWLFPPVCIACERPGPGLCALCSPAPCEVLHFAIGGVPAFALGSYSGTLRRAIVAMKHGERDLLDPLAGLLAQRAPLEGVLVPLPTSRGRAAQRGFDQSVEIARRLASARGTTLACALEKRGPPQAGRNRSERLRRGARFRVRGSVPARVTLIDDVVTTGATVRAAIEVLRTAGVEVRGTVVLARTPADPPRICRA